MHIPEDIWVSAVVERKSEGLSGRKRKLKRERERKTSKLTRINSLLFIPKAEESFCRSQNYEGCAKRSVANGFLGFIPGIFKMLHCTRMVC